MILNRYVYLISAKCNLDALAIQDNFNLTQVYLKKDASGCIFEHMIRPLIQQKNDREVKTSFVKKKINVLVKIHVNIIDSYERVCIFYGKTRCFCEIICPKRLQSPKNIFLA